MQGYTITSDCRSAYASQLAGAKGRHSFDLACVHVQEEIEEMARDVRASCKMEELEFLVQHF